MANVKHYSATPSRHVLCGCPSSICWEVRTLPVKNWLCLSLCIAAVSLLSLCALVYHSPIGIQAFMHMAIVGCNVYPTQQLKKFGNKSLRSSRKLAQPLRGVQLAC